MKSIALTNDWDIALNTEGDFYFLGGEEETQQAVSHVVFTFRGEDPFNGEAGIPSVTDIPDRRHAVYI